MQFSNKSPLTGLNIDENLKLFDFHVHLFNHWFFSEFLDVCKNFNITNMVGITSNRVKSKIEQKKLNDNIAFGYFLNSMAFTKYNIDKLIHQVTEAKENNFKLLKIFFGPRLWKVSRRKTPFRINDERLSSLYSKIESEKFPVLIHVADPDIWYKKRYTSVKKYGTKFDRLTDFMDLLKEYPNIKWISAHFGSLPEDLGKLGDLLNKFPNLSVDTGSTKWMIRELGKNTEESREWINKYQNRIVWGSDISNFQFTLQSILKKEKRTHYWNSRFWSHRLFWETSYQSDLAFKDSDNPEGTKINGLNLSQDVLNKIYFENAKIILDITD